MTELTWENLDRERDEEPTPYRTRSAPPPVHALKSLEDAVRLMHVAAGKEHLAKQSGRVAFYVERLKDFIGPELDRALSGAADANELLSVAELRTTAGIASRAKATISAATLALTTDQRQRSREAALKTALALHYKHDWEFKDFGATMLGAALRRELALTDAELVTKLEDAKKKYPREHLLRWLEES